MDFGIGSEGNERTKGLLYHRVYVSIQKLLAVKDKL